MEAQYGPHHYKHEHPRHPEAGPPPHLSEMVPQQLQVEQGDSLALGGFIPDRGTKRHQTKDAFGRDSRLSSNTDTKQFRELAFGTSTTRTLVHLAGACACS